MQANQVVFVAAAVLYTGVALRERRARGPFLLVIGVSFLMTLVMTGNRIYIALFMLALAAVLWLDRRWRVIAASGLAVPLLVVAFTAWPAIRGNRAALAEAYEAYTEIAQLDDRPLQTALMSVTDGVNVMLAMHIVNDFGTRFEYLGGLTYTKAATFFLPRSVYPSKPPNFETLVAQLYEPAASGLSLATTVVGELYANFGPATIVAMPLATWLWLHLSDRLSPPGVWRPLTSASLFLMAAWMVRSAFSDNFITSVFAVLLIWGLRLEARVSRPAAPDSLPNAAHRPAVGVL
jgi:hypothetical protein